MRTAPAVYGNCSITDYRRAPFNIGLRNYRGGFCSSNNRLIVQKMTMKTKATAILSMILFLYSVTGLADAIIYSWNMYGQLVRIEGRPSVANYYIASTMWKELFINLSTPVFACSLAFFVLKERFAEKKRRIIKFATYAASVWLLAALFFWVLL